MTTRRQFLGGVAASAVAVALPKIATVEAWTITTEDMVVLGWFPFNCRCTLIDEWEFL